MRFTKMHGIGNDYIYVNCFEEQVGNPEEVANIVVFICSEKASLLNGASIPADGGQGRSIL